MGKITNIRQYIAISEDDPAILIDWDDAVVKSFVIHLLEPQKGNAQFFLVLRNVQDENQLKDALMSQYATESGGRFGNTLLHPLPPIR